MKKKALLLIAFWVIMGMNHVFCQTLKLVANDNMTSLNRSNSDGEANIIIKSRVKNLEVYTNWNDKILHPFEDEFILIIPITEDVLENGENKRIITFKSPKSSVLEYKTNIYPNQRLQLNVYLPSVYPFFTSTEYVFSKSAHSLRFTGGKQIGGFLEYSWGDFYKAGNAIESADEDYGVAKAVQLGYVRKAIIGGISVGLFYKDGKFPFGLYTLVGGGYGEYARQWQNPSEVMNNIYFYSDCIKGFEGEVALLFSCGEILCFSIGSDVLFGAGKVSVDYRIGIGIRTSMTKIRKWFKIRKK